MCVPGNAGTSPGRIATTIAARLATSGRSMRRSSLDVTARLIDRARAPCPTTPYCRTGSRETASRNWRDAVFANDALAGAMLSQKPTASQVAANWRLESEIDPNVFAVAMKWSREAVPEPPALPVLAELEASAMVGFDFPQQGAFPKSRPLRRALTSTGSDVGPSRGPGITGAGVPGTGREGAQRSASASACMCRGHETWKLERISRQAWFYRQARERCTKAGTDGSCGEADSNSTEIAPVQTRAAAKLRGFRSGWNDGRHGGGRERCH